MDGRGWSPPAEGTTTTNDASTGPNATTGDSDGATAPTSADGSDMGIPCEPDPVPEVCRDYGDRWVECIYDGAIPADGIQDGCSCFLQLALDMYGDDCVSALEDYYACIAQAECTSIAIDEACSAEADVIQEICPSLNPG